MTANQRIALFHLNTLQRLFGLPETKTASTRKARLMTIRLEAAIDRNDRRIRRQLRVA